MNKVNKKYVKRTRFNMSKRGVAGKIYYAAEYWGTVFYLMVDNFLYYNNGFVNSKILETRLLRLIKISELRKIVGLTVESIEKSFAPGFTKLCKHSIYTEKIEGKKGYFRFKPSIKEDLDLLMVPVTETVNRFYTCKVYARLAYHLKTPDEPMIIKKNAKKEREKRERNLYEW